jgi:hypothetical protein
MPDIKVKGGIQQLDKVIKNAKDKTSNFFLTINTNQQYQQDDPNLQNDIAVFEECIKNILSNINNYVNISEGIWDDEHVNDVDIDYVIELGPVKKHIHAHIMIKIKHRTKLMLDLQKIKSKILSDLGLKNIYMNNKLMKKDSSTNVLDYIHKYTPNKKK